MPTIESLPDQKKETAACPLCGTALNPANITECPNCDWVLGYRRQKDHLGEPEKRDTAALIMSVAPGLGHIYKGHPIVGLSLIVGTVLVGLVTLATVSATAGVALLLIPIYWTVVMLHAYWADDLHSPRMSPPPLPRS